MKHPWKILLPAALLALQAAPLQAAPLLAQSIDRGTGFYVAWWKILLIWLVVLLWTHAADWISRDSQVLGEDIGLPQHVWNPVVVFTFLALFIVALVVPLFAVTLVLVLAAYLGPVATYVLMRNPRVTDDQKVLTPTHIKHWLSNLGKRGPRTLETVLPHQLGAPVEFIATGEDLKAAQANLIAARQSEQYVDIKELVADIIDRGSDRAMLDYTADSVGVRYEIDGVWHSLDARERAVADPTLEAFKTLCGLNPADRRGRQTGDFKCKYNDNKYQGELTSQGTKSGERVVIAIDDGGQLNTLEEIGMRPALRTVLADQLREAAGLIVISAMPGGGLTTTWTVALKSTDRLLRDFIAIEDQAKPNPYVENVAVEKYDLAAGRTPDQMIPDILLRQPEVLVVPEPPNAETVRMLCDEVNSQDRLVITSVRAKESVESLLRILLLKAPAAPFAEAVTCAVNSRLIRKLCNSCKQAYEPPPQLLQRLGIPADRVEVLYREWQPPPEGEQKKEPEVCQTCSGIGYHGRTALFELLVVDDTIRKLLNKQPKLDLLRKAARKAGTRTLQEEGILLVAKGVTSLNELQRVLKL